MNAVKLSSTVECGGLARVIEQTTALTPDPKDIARAELARWRRRLGPLTSEQEEKIESVLMSIAIRTSQLATTVMDSLLSAKVN